ncbi:PQQ-binding-like beta-propeller repeat protein [Nocardiopsis sp. CT-R113]|uniref:PQQ-binding-like beta-propeller repeat protein n=1 Tax=Nocardiopsis codii TaxID=3065942 RepID=A0ABU7K2J4_9ACTN|nr:PQQ-binding-like beta-propeller repeat protein [Nocardiopsis sp. CT-R113]MEE2036469.1 PQQ-binding-like beta-propeller repeat protein [Nocardiopsis sp. CT-R113]
MEHDMVWLDRSGRSVRIRFSIFFLPIFIVGCSSQGHEVTESVVELEHRSAVSEIAWDWAAPDSSRSAVFPVPGGVAVLQAAGVVVLSGETGEELWQYRISEGEVSGNVSDDGRHVVLRSEGDTGEGTGGTELTVLDSGTGEIVREFDSSDVEAVERVGFAPQIGESLSGVTGDIWVVQDEAGVTAHQLEDGEVLWSSATADLAACAAVGSVDDLAVLEDVVVAAFTCYEQPEGEDPVDMTEGREFVSGLAGIDPTTGEELWRSEGQAGLFPADSHSRVLTVQGSGLIVVEYPYEEVRQLADPSTGDVTDLGRNNVLWSNSDGSELGVWHAESRDYRHEGRSGEVLASFTEEAGAAPAPTVSGGGFLGLEDGVLYLAEEVEGGEDAPVLAYFAGFQGASEITADWDAQRTEVHDVVSVPGAVAVSYTDGEGRSGVIGLR